MFQPILDRVLIKRIEPEPTADGFVVPEKYRQHTNRGLVVSVGEEVDPHVVWNGAVVLYGEYTAEQLSLDGEDYWIVRLADIRGVEHG